jgi:hypothetical protein
MATEQADGSNEGTYKLHGIPGRTFDPARTAVLVIDPVNDFLTEDGAAWELTESTVTKHDVIGHLRQLIDGVRAKGVPGLYGPMAYTADDYAHQELHRRTGINRIMFEQQMFLAGSWGADFHDELRPADDEAVLHPHKGTDVAEVVDAAPDRPGYVLVERGIFRSDTYVPLDAVVKVSEGKAFVNIPELMVGKMPWDEAPTAAARLEKVGPEGSSVDALYGTIAPTKPGP